ncbi:response regulator transcription factor [Paenibacillus sp. MMS20-IR301]|uniref:response regulator transcription factor n=1 Tax=Paenibacillus sp. MMS20-IR301 TaxID=2895946 RepID=UPI0028EF4C31|nr:response regulator transcription factor [Paenibacillus sp. MMS20-IR301]WNS46986.1 response regulator transcription factor [Paenibacillus sp. MMS20-IR301]
MQKIMLVEDDPKIAGLLQTYIERYGYQVHLVQDLLHVMEDFTAFSPVLVLLDINLPSYDGYYWCRQIRKISTCPVLFISARSGEMDQIMALENGGDDYIVKPFHYGVVMAKIQSHLRRAYGEYAFRYEERVVESQGLVLYPERLELHLGEQMTILTKKECDLMELLLERYPRISSREMLLEKLWDDQVYIDENTLNVNINRLRKKLHEIGIDQGILTVRGMGYLLNTSVWAQQEEV